MLVQPTSISLTSPRASPQLTLYRLAARSSSSDRIRSQLLNCIAIVAVCLGLYLVATEGTCACRPFPGQVGHADATDA